MLCGDWEATGDQIQPSTLAAWITQATEFQSLLLLLQQQAQSSKTFILDLKTSSDGEPLLSWINFSKLVK